MKHLTSYIILLTTFLFLLTSCDYKDLCYDHNHNEEGYVVLQLQLKLDLDLKLDVDVEMHTKIEQPEYMKVCLYDPESGVLKDVEYIKGDRGPLHAASGVYNMVVYAFGTEWTQIRGENDVNTLEAFTSDISSVKANALASFTRAGDDETPGPIIYTPDHLLVAHKLIEIPEIRNEDIVVTLQASAATIIETYSFEVRTVIGAEYISSAEAFVTNQARSNFFGRGEVNKEPATISFPMYVDKELGRLKTTFNTFGKLPGESRSYLHILLVDTDGKTYHVSADITDQFEKEDHEIIIEEEVDIPQPQGAGGGIAPTVDQWEEENHDVPIG